MSHLLYSVILELSPTKKVFHLEKQALREYIKRHLVVSDYTLHTTTWYFPKHIQKGFEGTCAYRIKTDEPSASQLAALASFARYAGIGYKTTMGMGQTRVGES